MGPAADSSADRPYARDIPSEREPKQRFVQLPDGRRLAVRVWRGTGVPVILLHGLLDDAVGWDALARAMQNPSIAFDLPGFGRSDLPTRPRLSAYAEDVIAALDELEIEQAIIVGHSLGGGIAAAVADRAPERVRYLVLLAPAGFGRIHLAEAISIPGFRDVVARVLPHALANDFVLTTAYRMMVTSGAVPDDDLLDRVVRRAAQAVPGAREATHAVVAAGLSKRGFHRRRLSFDGPVVAVWGDRDRLVPIGHAEGVRTAFPRARVETWAGMGHHPQRERPHELAALVTGVCADCLPHEAPADDITKAA